MVHEACFPKKRCDNGIHLAARITPDSEMWAGILDPIPEIYSTSGNLTKIKPLSGRALR